MMQTQMTADHVWRLALYPAVAPGWLAEIASAAPGLEAINCSTEQEAVDALREADAFCGQITPEMLAVASRLRWVQAPRIGLEHYMFPALAQSDVVLTNVRGIYGDVVADHAMSLVLCLARELHVYARRQREHTWQRSTPLVDLPGSTMGIIGLGGIGVEVARRALGFGMHVVAVDPRRADRPEGVVELWKPDRLSDLLAVSDFVVICAPHTPETERMIRAGQLARMKRTAYLVNVGRGAIVDLADLTEALQTGVIAGAGLDVFEVEPLPADHPLWDLPNVILTPHVAYLCANDKIDVRCLRTIVDNVRRFVAGEPLRNVVDKQMWY
jgi:phosphoglycerate dehydrogenase-like enzyme